MDTDIAQTMLDQLLASSEEFQKESAMLAGNARFVLRMSQGEFGSTVGSTIKAIRDALVRGIPELGGEIVSPSFSLTPDTEDAKLHGEGRSSDGNDTA